jgi:iron-sulfur cluster repair protein YtfE (RIC family)
LVDRAIAELVRHMVVEEQYLYPAVRKRVHGGEAVADKEIADHAAAERTMRDLAGVPVHDERFEPLASRLIAEVRHHVQDEEQTLFPLLASSCSPQELAELGRKVQAARRLAPTRPHPGAPDKPPMNMLVAPGVGLVDRIRDSVTGRRAGA